MLQDNPAARLYEIFSELNSIPKGASIRDAFARIFGIDKNNNGEILNLMTGLIEQVRQAHSSINQIENIRHEIYLKPIIVIEDALIGVSFQTGVDALHGRIKPIMDNLEFCADLLSREQSEGVLEEDNLSELNKLASDLKNKVIEDNQINIELKIFLTKSIDEFINTLTNYRVMGVRGIKTSIEKCLGKTVIHVNEIQKTTTPYSSSDTGYIRLWFEIMDKCNSLVTFGGNAAMIASPIIVKLLDRL